MYRDRVGDMTTKAMLKCKRTRLETCKGYKSDPIESYNKWAYWCGNELYPAWRNSACKCGVAIYIENLTSEWKQTSINELGVEVLGSREETKKWLNVPVHGLEGQRPIDVMRQESPTDALGRHAGLERVKGILLAIVGGAYT